MNGWYWLLWAVVTAVNAVLWFGSRWNLRQTQRLIKIAREHRSIRPGQPTAEPGPHQPPTSGV